MSGKRHPGVWPATVKACRARSVERGILEEVRLDGADVFMRGVGGYITLYRIVTCYLNSLRIKCICVLLCECVLRLSSLCVGKRSEISNVLSYNPS